MSSRPVPTLRVATVHDAREITALVRTAYRDTTAGGWTTEAHLLADERIDLDEVTAKIARPSAVVLVAHDLGQVLLGCCEVVRQGADVAYFGMFAVRPASQAGGHGSWLLAAAEDLARERWGSTRMEMTVIAQRADLIAWYERRGYRRTGERRPFPYGHLVNGVALRDDLYFDVLMKDLTSERITS